MLAKIHKFERQVSRHFSLALTKEKEVKIFQNVHNSSKKSNFFLTSAQHKTRKNEEYKINEIYKVAKQLMIF